MKTIAGWILLAGAALAAPAPLPRLSPPVVRPGLYHFTWGNMQYVGRLYADGRYTADNGFYQGHWQQNPDGSFWLTERIHGLPYCQYRIDLRSDYSGRVSSADAVGHSSDLKFQMRRLGP